MTNSTRYLLFTLVMTMSPIIGSAQTPTTTTRTTVAIDNENIRQAVTSVVTRDGKLGLIGANPARIAFPPTGVLTNDAGIKLVFRDGRLAEMAGPSTTIASMKYAGADLRTLDATTSKVGVSLAVTKVYVRSIAVSRDGSVRAIGGPVDISGIRDPGDITTYSYAIPNGSYKGVVESRAIIIDWTDSRPTSFLLKTVSFQ